MNIKDINLEQYNSMTIKEKEDFFNKISKEKKSSCTYTIAIRMKKTKNMKIRGQHQNNGRLRFIEELRRTDKAVTNFHYLCLCDCGNWTIITNRHFDKEDIVSCGCYKKELLPILGKTGNKNYNDLTNQIFGDLKVIEKTNKRIHDGIVWICECINCGARQEVQGAMLTEGKRCFCEQCGQRKSKGEKIIISLLNILNLPFEQEKSFYDCIFDDTQMKGRFDFFVDNKYIIEFDGIQHFEVTGGWGTKEQLIKPQKHDKIKNEYCKKHNIPIIRIPYYHIDKICLKDLMLETSPFLLQD